MSLNKTTLTDRVWAANPELTKTQAREAVLTILNIITASLEKGDDVLLSGFGKFNIKDKPARKGRNPRTGASMILNAKRVVTFKPSGKLKELVNNS